MANVTENRINITMNAADQDALDAALTTITEILNRYTKTLTDDERATLSSVAQENLVFTEDALKQGQLLTAKLSPESVVIVNNMDADLSLWHSFDALFKGKLSDIRQRVEDTRRLAAHEAYNAALALYAIFQAMASIGIDGFQNAVDVLKGRFANQGGRPPAA